jgi:site-specific recombinase XerD
VKYPAEILDDDEVRRLIMAPSTDCPTGVRNRALLVLLYRSGLRISEALDLKPSDLDASKGTIRVLHGKGDKARTVGMDPMAFGIVQNWMTVRSTLGYNGHNPLFCTLKGGPMSYRYIRAMMKRIAKRAKIEKRVHAHGLRHQMAVEMAREGQPITTIQLQLGHARASTTATYLSRISPQEAIDAARARSWSGGPETSLIEQIRQMQAQLNDLCAQAGKVGVA